MDGVVYQDSGDSALGTLASRKARPHRHRKLSPGVARAIAKVAGWQA